MENNSLLIKEDSDFVEFTSHGLLLTCYVIWRSRQRHYKSPGTNQRRCQQNSVFARAREYLYILTVFHLAPRPGNELPGLLLVVLRKCFFLCLLCASKTGLVEWAYYSQQVKKNYESASCKVRLVVLMGRGAGGGGGGGAYYNSPAGYDCVDFVFASADSIDFFLSYMF